MREILFRGKFDNGGGQICWTEGDLIHYSKEEVYILDQNFRLWDIPHDGCKVDVNTLGQFTGFTDKNGTKIFEGDIVRMTSVMPLSDFGCEFVGRIVFSDLMYYIDNDKKSFPLFNEVDEYEVVGNIHDNPELL